MEIVTYFLSVYRLACYTLLHLFGCAGLRCCAWAPSRCGEQGPLLVAVQGLLSVAAALCRAQVLGRGLLGVAAALPAEPGS